MKSPFSLCVLCLLVFLVSPIVSASWTSAQGSFVKIDWRVCAIEEPTFCIPDDEIATIKKYSKWRIILWVNGNNIYVTKRALYYFPMNDQWRRIELNTQKLRRLNSSHFTDGTSYFYNWLSSMRGIERIGSVSEWKLKLFSYGVSALKSKLFYHWVEMPWYNPEKISISLHQITESAGKYNFTLLWHDNVILLESNNWFYKISGIDRASFKVIDMNTFEDKNKKYFIEYGPYSVTNVEIITK